jgi:hypothetical protein
LAFNIALDVVDIAYAIEVLVVGNLAGNNVNSFGVVSYTGNIVLVSYIDKNIVVAIHIVSHIIAVVNTGRVNLIALN